MLYVRLRVTILGHVVDIHGIVCLCIRMSEVPSNRNVISYYDKEENVLKKYDLRTGKLISVNNENTYQCIPFTDHLASILCDMVRSGKTISSIAKMEGMPSLNMIYFWRGKYPEFRHQMDQARRDRATYFNDIVIEELGELRGKRELSLEEDRRTKLVMNMAMKLAEKDSPQEYTPANNNISLDNKVQVVITGVPVKDEEKDEYGKTVFECE